MCAGPPPLLRSDPLRKGEGFLACIPCQRPRCAGRWRDGGAGAETLGVQARDDLLFQRGLAAEQMRTAGDVEKKTIGRINYDDGRKAFAPIGDGVEHARVFIRLSFNGCEIGPDRARVSERHSEAQAQFAGAQIHARQQEGVCILGVDGKRTAFRRAPSADQPIRRQARQKDRQPARLFH